MTTGIFELHFSLHGNLNFNLVPFAGSSIIPVMLNWLLFVPCGFLMPFIFPSFRWNGRKAALIGGAVSLMIEVLQLYGGRYAEIDDVLLNILGAVSGYYLFAFVHSFRINRKKAVISLFSLCCVLAICFTGLYFIGDHGAETPDGLYTVEYYISEIKVYCGGEKHTIDRDSYVYRYFESQLSNCGGHLLKRYPISEGSVINEQDCYIEVIYQSPQTIHFENAKDFTISDADRILYNADTNMLYWGISGYQHCLDFIELEEALAGSKEQILEEYKQLKRLITEYFL